MTTGARTLAYLSAVPVERVKGIGPARARSLAKLGIASVADLLLHVPRRYLDRSRTFDLSDVPLGEEVTIFGTVLSTKRRRISGGRVMIDARISDGTNVVDAVWFNPYLKVEEGWEVAMSGTVSMYRGRLQMRSPELERFGAGSLAVGRIVPVHPAVAKLSPAKVRAAVDNALRRSRPIAEVLPPDLVERLGLVDRDTAFADVHFPDDLDAAARARRRLAFDELFRLEVGLALRKHRQVHEATGIVHDGAGELVDAYLAALPYELTGAQRRALDEIEADLRSPLPMHRLLQGEVGSGKTAVAVCAMLRAVSGGYQAAVMAPTEVLATQHYLGISAALAEAGLAPDRRAVADEVGTESLFAARRPGPEVAVALLTSNAVEVNFAPRASRSDVVGWVAAGDIDLVVGTHALIQEGVTFARLGLAVVDEQHRFGVYQRVMLREKSQGYDPDLLIMTATPIPRTLAMTLYGDLDVSLIDEMPPGRSPVRTRHVTAFDDTVHELIRSEVASGHQVFVVCPLVEDSDKLAVRSATAEYERLSASLDGLEVGLLHGQLRPAEKDAVMAEFRAGRIDVLVATTVIEVGVDVPNATTMVVIDADRFGLSQLHQLRGRVGRGAAPGTCVLIADPTTPEGERRIAAMVATTDGFALAEEDLRIRGQGTVLGARQAGMTDLKIADILRDADLLVHARREAFALVDDDPDLAHHRELAEELRILLGEDVAWLERS